jgi:hypothetical protein
MVRPQTALFGGAKSAAETIAEAKEIAKVLADTLRECPDLISIIEIKNRGGQVVRRSEHVNFEGWTLLGVLLGAVGGASVHADVEWTRRILPGEGQPAGWEARAVARMSDGTHLSSAEMMCTRDEDRWTNREDFQIRSMAQTRAQAKAIRQVLGWIMSLAGYSATPGEEMEALDAESQRAARQIGGPVPTFRNVGELMTWATKFGNEQGYPLDSRAICRIVGVEKPADIKDFAASGAAIQAEVARALGGPPPSPTEPQETRPEAPQQDTDDVPPPGNITPEATELLREHEADLTQTQKVGYLGLIAAEVEPEIAMAIIREFSDDQRAEYDELVGSGGMSPRDAYSVLVGETGGTNDGETESEPGAAAEEAKRDDSPPE